MSASFSANQYENAFRSAKLGNWEVPDGYRQMPGRRAGCTQIIGNECGHLLEGVPRSRNNPWGNFVGTWDIPKKIPGNCAKVATARTHRAQEKLVMEHETANEYLAGDVKNANRRVMREGSGSMGKLPPVSSKINSNSLHSSDRRSGAAAPGSKMLATTSPTPRMTSPAARLHTPVTRRTPTPIRARSLTPMAASPYPDFARSSIPGVPDVPEILQMLEDQKRTPVIRTPGPSFARDGLLAM